MMAVMADWSDLTRELDAWSAAGLKAGFWWRDDDAVAPSDALDRILAIASETGAPLALAVIPKNAETALAARLDDGGAAVGVLQHGYAHANHAGEGDKKSELGRERPAEIVIAELGVGWERIAKLFGARALPVMVPPWNRIAPHIVPMLPEMGYRGLSTFEARKRAEAVRGLTQVNTHIDVIDWKGSRTFVGTDTALAAAIDHLRARRIGTADRDEPTGLLTHHLAHDPPADAFIAEFIERTSSHSAAHWLAADKVFPAREAARAAAQTGQA
jgi:hypothetical protein